MSNSYCKMTFATHQMSKRIPVHRFSVSLRQEDVDHLDKLAERYNHKRARMASYILLKYLKDHPASHGSALEPLDVEIQLRLAFSDSRES